MTCKIRNITPANGIGLLYRPTGKGSAIQTGAAGFFLMLLAIAMLSSAPAAAQPSLALNTQSVEMCPCSTTRVVGTLQSAPPGTYSLGSDSNWATAVPPSVSLGAGESASIYAYITPDCPTAPGKYSVKINAESSVGSASATVDVNILECHGASLKPAAARKSACIDDVANFDIAVTNIGKTTEIFNVSADMGSISPEEVSLNAGETTHVTLYAAPKIAEQKITVTAASTTSYAKKSTSVTLLGENCYAPELSVVPSKSTVCRGLPAKYNIVLKNLGTRDDRYAVSGDFGSISGGRIPVSAGEQKTVALEVPTENKTLGESRFYVTLEPASRPDMRISEEVTLIVENCYFAQLSAKNASATICPGMPKEFILTAKNTGNLSDTYILGADRGALSDSTITLGAGEEKTLSLTIGTALNDTQDIEDAVSMKSKNAEASEKVTLKFETFGACYDFAVSGDPDKIILQNRTSGLAVINVKNNGKDTLDFVMRLEGPVWAYLDPAELRIPAGEERPAYLYVAPAYGTPEGEYRLRVQATNNGKVSKTADVNVVIGNPQENYTEEYNETTPSGNAIKSESLKKTVYLIVIGVIVIAAIFFLPDILSRRKKEGEEEAPVELKSEEKTAVEPDIKAVLEATEEKEAPEKEKMEEEGEKPAEKEEEAPKKRKRGRPPKKKSKAESGDTERSE